MGLFDRLRSIVGSAASVDLRGPLQLAVGDGVAYYREAFTVTGVRRLDAQGAVTWHYCLRDPQGAPSVLVLDESPELALSMHRVVAADVPWDQDVIEGLGEEPFRLAARRQATVMTTGDCGGPPCRAVVSRTFADASGDRFVVLEDWGPRREARVGEPVFETELAFTRCEADAEAVAEAQWFDARQADGASRGSAAAAARVLEGGGDEAHDVAEVVPREDHDPTAYSDDAWDDESEAPAAERPVTATLTVFDTEEDEWRAAAAFLREHGVPAET